jgi:hypothetical protein
MSEEHSVSRRASLKSLGAMGAAIVLGGGVAATPRQAEPKASDQGKSVVNVADLAVARFGKGHS